MKFLGAPYPIERHPRGFFHTQEGVNQIKSDLLVLLLTTPGERVMLPDYGTPLKELIFEQNDAVVVKKAREMIINSIRTWEPRITVENIEIGVPSLANEYDQPRQDVLDGHILGIRITFFDPENIQEVQELRLEVPLSGGR
jgi:phage baseplate assembly protein W